MAKKTSNSSFQQNTSKYILASVIALILIPVLVVSGKGFWKTYKINRYNERIRTDRKILITFRSDVTSDEITKMMKKYQLTQLSKVDNTIIVHIPDGEGTEERWIETLRKEDGVEG